MDIPLIAITLTSGPGITTLLMVMLGPIQPIQRTMVIGVMQMVHQVNLTCRQTLNLLRQWFSIRCVLGNHIPTWSRLVYRVWFGSN